MLYAVTSLALAAVCAQTLQISRQVEEAMAAPLRHVTAVAAVLSLVNGSAAVLTLLEFNETNISRVLLFVTAAMFVGLLGVHLVAVAVAFPKAGKLHASTFCRPIDTESPASPTAGAQTFEIDECEAQAKSDPQTETFVTTEVTLKVDAEAAPPPPPSFVLLDGRQHLQILRRGRRVRPRLSSINEEACVDTPKWMAYLGTHLATQILPRVPAGGKEHTWETVCETMTSLAAWLRSDDAEHLCKTFQPCLGFSCERCSNAVQPNEETCPVCKLAVE